MSEIADRSKRRKNRRSSRRRDHTPVEESSDKRAGQGTCGYANCLGETRCPVLISNLFILVVYIPQPQAKAERRPPRAAQDTL